MVVIVPNIHAEARRMTGALTSPRSKMFGPVSLTQYSKARSIIDLKPALWI